MFRDVGNFTHPPTPSRQGRGSQRQNLNLTEVPLEGEGQGGGERGEEGGLIDVVVQLGEQYV